MSTSAFYTSMTGLQSIDAQMEALSANLANTQTTGYQAVQVMTEAAPFGGASAPPGADVVALSPGPNTTAGALKHTGNLLDVGLNGDAWLQVQGPTGLALTRNGALQILPNGILADSSGNPVLSVSGAPISLPQLSSLTIGSDGTLSGISVSQPGQSQNFGQIGLAATPASALTSIGNSLYVPANANQIQPSTSGSLSQGYLNGSNVDSVQGMVQLISASRSYQIQTQLLKTQSVASTSLNAVLAQG
ncbi:flagellar hook-basal body complex protein [Acidisoma sp. C75]